MKSNSTVIPNNSIFSKSVMTIGFLFFVIPILSSILFSWFGLRSSVVSKSIFGSSESLFNMSLSSITLSLSLSGLLSPVILSDFLIRETTRRTSLVLDMVGSLSTSSAKSVDFGVSLTE